MLDRKGHKCGIQIIDCFKTVLEESSSKLRNIYKAAFTFNLALKSVNFNLKYLFALL